MARTKKSTIKDGTKTPGPSPGPVSAWENRIIESGWEEPDQLLYNPFNARFHPLFQQEALTSLLREVGWVQRVIVNKRTQHIVDGHLRVSLAHAANERVPVDYVDLSEDEERLLLATFDRITQLAVWDVGKVDELLPLISTSDVALSKLLADLRHEVHIPEAMGAGKSGVDRDARPNPRRLPIDVIYTLQGADATCCLAAQAGLKYGIPSHRFRLCPCESEFSGRHKVTFIDNNYFAYDHALHVEVVKRFRPKYCTVVDVMTPAQADIAKVEFAPPLDQILDFAEELAEYAQNVIVIPKYDCLDRIPEKFMLGYSIPTSHGGTPLPFEAFKGRRIHLLGGSWADQLAYMAALGEDVLSADNNHIHKMAQFGQYTTPSGEMLALSMNFPHLTNPLYASLALSFGAIGAKIHELYPSENAPQIVESVP